MSEPKLLLMDEPSMGLAPLLVRQVAQKPDVVRAYLGGAAGHAW
jgi:ABC-type branched-subunit amino acid transport system ATPase component